jgi:hypothetical protein
MKLGMKPLKKYPILALAKYKYKKLKYQDQFGMLKI